MNVEALKVDLMRDEGCRMKPYRDSVGKLTIGIGRNLDDNGITLEEAKILLENDITTVLIELDNKLRWWRELPEPAQRGLANMAFNLGLYRLLGFHKMLAALEHGEMQIAAASALDSKWAGQVGDRAKRIASLFQQVE